MWIGISVCLSLPAANGAQLQIGGTTVARGDGGAAVRFFIGGIANPTEEYLLTASGGAYIEHWVEYGF